MNIQTIQREIIMLLLTDQERSFSRVIKQKIVLMRCYLNGILTCNLCLITKIYLMYFIWTSC